jgi:molybdenum cofactor cytidylyltransferase
VRLKDALALRADDVVAFIGAGGKTSALARLARELSADGARVLATTTTRIAADERSLFTRALPVGECERLHAGESLFVYDHLTGEKAIGIAPEALPALIESLKPDYTLIEADGARRLPLKAPKVHEPVIPPQATLVVHVAGYGALGQPLDEAHVYNADGLAQVCAVKPGIQMTAETLAMAVSQTLLPFARHAALINAVPASGSARAIARRVARLALAGGGLAWVLVGAVQADDPIFECWRPLTALVLAAGLSSRMGQSKPLLDWGGRTVLEQIIGQLHAGGVHDVQVITGAQAEAVAAAATRAGAVAVHNPDYAEGEMLSSLQTGLRLLRDTPACAALVTLGDQPMLRAMNVRRIMQQYAEGGAGIVAPSYDMRRGHPILIDRRYWDELLALPAGSAPRDVINRYAHDTAYIETDDSVLGDIDTPDAYQAARQRAGLGE